MVHTERDYSPRTDADVKLETAKIVFQTIWKFFHHNELGQDLAEYCLLTALIALIALGIFVHVAGGVDAIWGSANSALATGNASNTAGTTQSPGH
jgi:Flp pilus assembly pilin Flp